MRFLANGESGRLRCFFKVCPPVETFGKKVKQLEFVYQCEHVQLDEHTKGRVKHTFIIARRTINVIIIYMYNLMFQDLYIY